MANLAKNNFSDVVLINFCKSVAVNHHAILSVLATKADLESIESSLVELDKLGITA
jgi:hypothetical protein